MTRREAIAQGTRGPKPEATRSSDRRTGRHPGSQGRALTSEKAVEADLREIDERIRPDGPDEAV